MTLRTLISAVALSTVASVVVVTMPSAQAASPLDAQGGIKYDLTVGQTLQEGDVILSANKTLGFSLTLQGDGNLVEYVSTSHRVVWASNTHGSGNRLVFQRDHNIVLYSRAGKALWQTRTYGKNVETFGITADGRLAATNSKLTQVYFRTAARVFTPGSVVIAALVSANLKYDLLLQGDGNLVLYSLAPKRHSVWSTSTTGHPKSTLVLQPSGNLVLTAQNGAVTWQSHTNGHAGTRLAMQRDGNLVLYSGDTAIWSTHTAGK